jgi:hypothetical protein
MADAIFALGFLLSYVVAWRAPRRVVMRHLKRQRGIIQPCNAYFLSAVRALDLGNVVEAERLLEMIRRREALWKFGNSNSIRFAVNALAFGWGFLSFMAARIGAIAIASYINWQPTLLTALRDAMVLDGVTFMMAGFALLHALVGLSLVEWIDAHQLHDLGDRLERLIKSPKCVAPFERAEELEVPSFDGMTSHQILGVSTFYTMRDLAEARRRLAMALHPDRWANSSVAIRRANEEAMKRVNQAYDDLRKTI